LIALNKLLIGAKVMDAKKIIFTLAAATFLAGCQTTKPTVAVTTVERPELVLPSVDQVRLSDVQWYVIARNAKPEEEGSVDKAFGKARSESLFATTPKGYENLAVNNAQLVRTVRQLQAQVAAYKEYYNTKKEDQGKK
jgi:hypothetical protein